MIDDYDFDNNPYKYDPKDANIDDISEDSNPQMKESSLNFEVHDASQSSTVKKQPSNNVFREKALV